MLDDGWTTSINRPPRRDGTTRVAGRLALAGSACGLMGVISEWPSPVDEAGETGLGALTGSGRLGSLGRVPPAIIEFTALSNSSKSISVIRPPCLSGLFRHARVGVMRFFNNFAKGVRVEARPANQ